MAGAGGRVEESEIDLELCLMSFQRVGKLASVLQAASPVQPAPNRVIKRHKCNSCRVTPQEYNVCAFYGSAAARHFESPAALLQLQAAGWHCSMSSLADAWCDASDGDDLQFIGPLLLGQTKWLGAAVMRDGSLVGVPGHARQVLRVDPRLHRVTLLGRSRGQDVNRNGRNVFKWLRGVSVGDKAYGIPMHGDAVLKVTPRVHVSKIELLDVEAPGDFKWHGGQLAPNGLIYGVPCYASQVLRIDPRTDEVSYFGDLGECQGQVVRRHLGARRQHVLHALRGDSSTARGHGRGSVRAHRTGTNGGRRARRLQVPRRVAGPGQLRLRVSHEREDGAAGELSHG